MSKKREDYSNELKWNIKDLYKTEKLFQEEYDNVSALLQEYKKYKGNIMSSAKNLYDLLEFDTNVSKRIEKLYIYAHIQNDQDTANIKYQTLYGTVHNLYEKYDEETSFITPEILTSDYSKIATYIKELPDLEAYERVLKDLFKFKKFTLSKTEEELLSKINALTNTGDDVYSLLTDADMTFGTIKNDQGEVVELNEKTYHKLIESPNREVRASAFTKLFTRYGEFKNTYAALLNSEIKRNNKIAEIRGYNNALHRSLYAHDIPESIYHNLIDNVKKNTAALSKFWQLKKDILKLDELHLYDTYASITKSTNKEYTIDEARELILKSLSILGDDYLTNLKKAFSDKWIDYCPNDNKRNGAYCTACYSVHPYVLLSFDGTLNNVSTLAHELGHAMHYYYAINNQAYQDYNYSIFVAEVASQVNQILLSKYLIANSNDIEEKKYLIDDLIGDFKATIYRQTMFADFEYQVHELERNDVILTHENISDLYYKLNQEYNGENIVIDDLIRYEWERIPHFYMNFYVYQYATAYAASIKIASDIMAHKEGAVANYLEFLKLGSTKTPIESLKVAGVDMESPNTINEAFVYFKNLVDELETLIKEVK